MFQIVDRVFTGKSLTMKLPGGVSGVSPKHCINPVLATHKSQPIDDRATKAGSNFTQNNVCKKSELRWREIVRPRNDTRSKNRHKNLTAYIARLWRGLGIRAEFISGTWGSGGRRKQKM